MSSRQKISHNLKQPKEEEKNPFKSNNEFNNHTYFHRKIHLFSSQYAVGPLKIHFAII